MIEIAVIGAGIAGLTCAQQLHQADRQVVVIDKSRGLGGRLATRRLGVTHADHGVCYLRPKGEPFRAWIEELVAADVLRVWTEGIHSLTADGILQPPSKLAPCYAAPEGATAVAKYLARDLEIISDRHITTITPIPDGWQINGEDWSIEAAQVIIAIPPAQALAISMDVMDSDCAQQISSVRFTPSIVAIAVYPASQQSSAAQLPWQGIQCEHPELGWIGLDSSKQLAPQQPILVVQSSGAFATQNFDAPDLSEIGAQLLALAEPFAPGLHHPELVQVHRWGYAFAQNPIPAKFVSAKTAAPLYFCGDWCGGDRVESAYLSGLALAGQIL
jgi:renalase